MLPEATSVCALKLLVMLPKKKNRGVEHAGRELLECILAGRHARLDVSVSICPFVQLKLVNFGFTCTVRIVYCFLSSSHVITISMPVCVGGEGAGRGEGVTERFLELPQSACCTQRGVGISICTFDY
jgi:hypothetical protein